MEDDQGTDEVDIRVSKVGVTLADQLGKMHALRLDVL